MTEMEEKSKIYWFFFLLLLLSVSKLVLAREKKSRCDWAGASVSSTSSASFFFAQVDNWWLKELLRQLWNGRRKSWNRLRARHSGPSLSVDAEQVIAFWTTVWNFSTKQKINKLNNDLLVLFCRPRRSPGSLG